MSTSLKRALSSTSRSVSPPAVRRKHSESNIGDLLSRQSVSSATKTSDLSQALRIYSWNVNGIDPLLQKRLTFAGSSEGALSPLQELLKRHNWPQILCLQEVKINSRDEKTRRQLQHAANAGNLPEKHMYVAHFSLPRDKYNATGFGGKVHGVATLIREDLQEHLLLTRKPNWDLEGRVLIHEFNTGLVVINGYWVNGTSNPYRNPDDGSLQGTRHDHKLRFHQRMLEESKRLESEGKSLVLIGDMNIARSRIDGHPNLRTSPIQHVKNRDDFNSKFLLDEAGLQGVDVFRELHGESRKYTFFSRGVAWGQSCDRVDNIIVTKELYLAGAVLDTDICDNPQDRGHSDHVPLWISIDIAKMPLSTPKSQHSTFSKTEAIDM